MFCKKIRLSKIKQDLFHTTIEGKTVKIRVSSDAKESICKFLDSELEKNVNSLSEILPHKKNGHLKRITFNKEDFKQNDIPSFIKYDENNNWVNSKYTRPNYFKSVLKSDNQTLRMSKTAKPYFNQHLDRIVEQSVKKIINKLPKKNKGEHKGEIKRITIQKEDFD